MECEKCNEAFMEISTLLSELKELDPTIEFEFDHEFINYLYILNIDPRLQRYDANDDEHVKYFISEFSNRTMKIGHILRTKDWGREVHVSGDNNKRRFYINEKVLAECLKCKHKIPFKKMDR